MRFLVLALALAALMGGARAQCCTPNCTACNVDCVVGDWSAWGPCSVSCGAEGVQSRSRAVTVQPAGNGALCPNLTQTRVCGGDLCPSEFACSAQPTDLILLIENLGGTMGPMLQQLLRGIYAYDISRGAQIFADSTTRQGKNNLTMSLAVVDAPTNTTVSPFNSPTQPITDTISETGAFTFSNAAVNWGQAIDNAVTRFNTDPAARPTARRVIAILTNAVSSGDPFSNCDLAARAGIEIYFFGFGSLFATPGSANVVQGMRLASEPASQYFVAFPSFFSTTVYSPSFDSTFSPLSNEFDQIVRRLAPVSGGASCTIFGASHISTFDGSSFTFNGYGDFYLMAPCGLVGQSFVSSSTNNATVPVVQVRLEPCGLCPNTQNGVMTPQGPSSGRTCVTGMAFWDGEDNVAVTWNPTGEFPVVSFRTSLTSSFVTGPNQFNPLTGVGSNTVATVRQRAMGGFDVTLTNGRHVFALRLSHNGMGMDIQLLPDSTASLVGAAGLCGNYDRCPNNDFLGRDGTQVSRSATAGTVYQNFANTWRVADPTESLFPKALTYESHQFADWNPALGQVTAFNAYSDAARGACSSLPAGADFAASCAADVDALIASPPDSVSQAAPVDSYTARANFECASWCTSGLFYTAQFAQMYAQNPSLCRGWCNYQYSTQALLLTPNFLQLLHTSNFSDPNNVALLGQALDLRGTDLTDATFIHHPQITRGGRYTFQRTVQRSDICAPDIDTPVPSTNYTLQVACLPPPQNLLAPNQTQVYFGQWQFPIVQLRATYTQNPAVAPLVTPIIQSWRVLSFRDGFTGAVTNSPSVPIDFPNSLVTGFRPTNAGIYTVQFAISDGCWVQRRIVQVELVQRCCTPSLRLLAPPAAVWTRTSAPTVFAAATLSLNGSILQTSALSVPPASTLLEPTFGQRTPPIAPYPVSDTTRNQLTPSSVLTTTWNITGFSPLDNSQVNVTLVNVTADWTTVDVTRVTNGSLLSNVTASNTTVANATNSSSTFTPVFAARYLEYLRPVAVLDADFNTAISTQNSTLVTVITTVTTPTRSRVCRYTSTAASSFSRSVSFTPRTAAGTYNTSGSDCEGWYTLTSSTNVNGYSQWCSVNAEQRMLVTCMQRPVITTNCQRSTMFNYVSQSFPSVTIDPSASVDLQNRTLFYRYTQTSGPAAGTLPAFVCTSDLLTPCVITPTTPGTYAYTVGVSNACKESTQTVSFEAFCPNASTAAYVSPPTAVTQNSTDPVTVPLNASASVSPAPPASTRYIFTPIATPTPPAGAPAVNFTVGNSTASTLTVTAPFGGSYTYSLQVCDGCSCSAPVNATFMVTCTDITAPTIVGNITVTDVNGTYVSEAYSATNGGVNFRWNFTSVPAGSLITRTYNTNAFNVVYDVPGTYTLFLSTDNNCAYSTEQVTVTVTCTQAAPTPIITPPPSPVVTRAGNITLGLANNVTSSFVVSVTSPSGVTTVLYTGPFVDTVSWTPTVSGAHTLTVNVTNLCGTRQTAQVVANVACLYAFTAATANQNVTWTHNTFPRVQLNGVGSSLGTANTSVLTYSWRFLSAPVGSIFAPFTTQTMNTTSVVSTSSTNALDSLGNVVNQTTVTTITNVTQTITRNNFVTLKNQGSVPTDIFSGCFVPDLPGTYQVQLTVSDSLGCLTSEAVATVGASCNAQPTPVVRIDPGVNVTIDNDRNTLVVLDASGSTDANNDTLYFYWNVTQPAAYVNNSFVLQDANSATAQFVAQYEGAYQVSLIVSDGCSNASFTTVITVTRQCVNVSVIATSTFRVAYNYLSLAAAPLCLDGGEPTVNGVFSLAKNTSNTSLYSGPFQDSSYPDYSPEFTPLQNFITRLQCDTAFNWRLVAYEEDFGLAENPCASGNEQNTACGGSGVVVGPPPAPAESGKPVTEEAWFIAVMVIIAIVVAFGIVAAVYYFRKRSTA